MAQKDLISKDLKSKERYINCMVVLVLLPSLLLPSEGDQ